MTFIKKTTVLFCCLFFSLTVHAQTAYFFNIQAHNATAIQARLKKQLAKGKMESYKLSFPPAKNQKDSFSVIAYSVKENCRECLDAFLAQKEKLAPYIDIQKELSKSLVVAIQNNNMQMFDYLIQQHADINYECGICYNRSPLLMALSAQNYTSFFRLIDLGANANVADLNGHNAFHHLLFNYRKYNNISEKSIEDKTAQIIHIIDILVEKGVSLQSKDLKGISPLMLAGYTRDTAVFDHLKLKGATINLDNKIEVATLLNNILFAYPNEANLSGQNLFNKVVNEYQIPLTKELFDTQDLDKSYSIIDVVYANNSKIFDLLMNLNVNVNVKEVTNDNTPINVAITNGNAYMCDQLLTAGAKLDGNSGNYRKAFPENPELLRKFKLARPSK